jgi:lipoate-protein ligase A
VPSSAAVRFEEGLLSARDGLARDDAGFRALDAGVGAECAYVWEAAEPAVVLGRSGRIEDEVHAAACSADRVPVLRRSSGGGAVMVGPGCLNYSFLLSLERRPELRDVAESYRIVLCGIIGALSLRDLAIRGMADIALGDRKVGGSAQRRGRRALLHHGTVLYDLSALPLGRYLKQPTRQPAYRSGRSHGAFVSYLSLPRAELCARIAGAWPN